MAWIRLTCVFLLTAITSGQEETQLSYDISENLGQFTFVGDVATDSNVQAEVPQEEVTSLEFAVLTPATTDPDKYFTVDTQKGVLRTNKVIDRDTICPEKDTCPLNLRVAVVSTISNYIKILSVTVNILDANDNAPKFSPDTMSLSIPENTPITSSISIPSAQDPDSPQFGISYYSVITEAAEFALKQVNGTDGTVALYLVVRATLDREVKDFYQIVVGAFDKGNQSGRLTVDINIRDVNDNQPIFTPAEYITDVDETMKPGHVVIKVVAQDKDLGTNSELFYDFDIKTNVDFGTVFSINHTNGEIQLIGGLDYETQQSYTLVVTAKEVHHETIPAEAKVVVNVNDMNDNPPKIVTSSIKPNVEVLENKPVGTFLAHVYIQDPDSGKGGEFSCQLQNNVDNRFKLEAINPLNTEFKLSTNYIFNREKQDHYTLKFACEDKGSPVLRTTSEIPVTILDQNDNAPKFTQQVYEVEVAENNPRGIFLTQVMATDPDFGVNGQVEYALYMEAINFISIDAQSGNVTATEVFDYERYQSLSFGIIARDKGAGNHQTTAILRVNIINENDEPPVFTTEKFNFRVNETMQPFTKIGKLTIKERGPGLTNVTYGFREASQYRDFFSIDPQTGYVYTKRTFDADDESAQFYEFEVVVIDSEKSNLKSGAMVSVTILDVNDNRPEISFHNAVNSTISVASDFPKGQVVTAIKGTDHDSGQNGDLTYTIESGNSEKYFSLSESGGELRTAKELTQIQHRTFTLTISVYDKGTPPLGDIKVLKVKVNSSLSSSQPVTSDLVGTDNLTIVVVVSIISAVLIVILIVSIVLLQRKDKNKLKQKQRRLSKLFYDQQPVLQETRTCSSSSTSSGIGGSSGVMAEKSFDSIDKTNMSYSNEVSMKDEYPAVYQIGGYPVDKKVGQAQNDEEADSQISGQSGADSGRGSNDDPDLTTSHMSITQSAISRPSYSGHLQQPQKTQHHVTSSKQKPGTKYNNNKPAFPSSSHMSESHREHLLNQNPPVIPQRTHKSHNRSNNLDTRGYIDLSAKKVNSSITDRVKDESSDYKQTQGNYGYGNTSGDNKRTPAHTDESYVVNPHSSYI